MKFFRNKTDSEITIRGRTIAANSFFEIPASEYASWALDDTLVTALGTPANYTMSVDGATDYSTGSLKYPASAKSDSLYHYFNGTS